MRPFDILVIVLYLVGVVAVGLASRGKAGDVKDYFTARGGFHGGWGTLLVGLSIAATLFSGISFIVYTSTAFSSGAQIVLGAAGIPVAYLVLRFWFIPRYLEGSGDHAYDIIERRLGPAVRLTASAMFILLRLGWMSVMITAPTLVIMGAAGLGPEWYWPLVALIGLTCTFYTTIGGIRGVIVTDAVQFVVMMVGIGLIIAVILLRLDVPAADITRELNDAGRLDILDFSLDLTKPFTFWSVSIGLSIAGLGSYMGDLMMLQRYLASGSTREAARSFAVNTWGVILVIIALVGVGLLLWVWYRHHPDPQLPAKADQVLAYFIARELPAGIGGLLIAAILAATMSSMTSGIIALAGTLTNDWIRRFGPEFAAGQLYRFGRYASIGVGLLATLAAGFTSQLGTLFQMSQVVLGAFQGPMLGCMVIVVARWRVSPAAVLAGMGLGTLVGWLVAYSPVAVVWVATASTLVTLLVPLLHRLLTRRAGAGV